MEVLKATAAVEQDLKTFNALHDAIVEVKANLETHMKESTTFQTPYAEELEELDYLEVQKNNLNETLTTMKVTKN